MVASGGSNQAAPAFDSSWRRFMAQRRVLRDEGTQPSSARSGVGGPQRGIGFR